MPDLWDLEFRISRNEGDGYRWVQIHGNVLRDTSGARWKLVGRIRDIQEEKDRELLEMRKVSVDGVTGFCSYAFGMEQLASMRQRHARGTVLYVTMENLRDIQSQDGLTFADMLLDGFADAVRVCMEEECGLTLRYNETDFCIWLEGRTGQEGIRFYEKCVQILGRQFPENLFSLQLYAGIVTMEKDCRPRTLIGKAQQAEMIASKRQDGYTYWCCSEEELPRTNGAVARQGHQLVTPDYNANSNFVSLSLMLFSKGDGLDAQMYLLFRKLGLFYGAEQICLVMVQPDFHSTYMQYWWNDRYHPTDRERAKTYTDREMNRFISWLGEQELFSWSEKRPLKPEAVEFVRGEMAQNGYGIPLYDNGSLMAIFSVHNVSEQLFGHDEEEKNLLEVSRIIQGQLTQKRHDLASKAKSDFLSRMSHEIRTPMNGIIGMTQIALKNGDDQERVKDCLHKIQNSSDYLLGLINDILDMSKIESGKMSLQMSDFDMNGLIETVSELIGPQAKAKDILFIRDMELVHQWFYGDQMRISQVLINLLGNAVKFTPPGGHVTFSIREQKAVRNRGQLLFVVQDTGIGIRKEDQERVFRSFEQSQTTTVSRQKGTGLGLSISSRLIKMMGSTIQLESTPGVGSTFCFTLTLPFGQPYDKTEKEEIPDFSGMRVLVVEDNDLNAEIAQTLLEDIGFMVDLSYDGAQAVKRMEAMPPGTYDLILMDIMMPVMDGLEATKAIRAMNREDCKRIPIVAMSANVFDEDMKKSVECGMNGHLTKPVEIDKLYKLLREVLHR
jgi:signal transduction histidine kinase/CheY-like chemotaxis protein/GGDEF domain-containing protein